jgi:hypothetical protein
MEFAGKPAASGNARRGVGLEREDAEPATLVRVEDELGDLGARVRVELGEG